MVSPTVTAAPLRETALTRPAPMEPEVPPITALRVAPAPTLAPPEAGWIRCPLTVRSPALDMDMTAAEYPEFMNSRRPPRARMNLLGVVTPSPIRERFAPLTLSDVICTPEVTRRTCALYSQVRLASPKIEAPFM